jgi:hypothetical protein
MTFTNSASFEWTTAQLPGDLTKRGPEPGKDSIKHIFTFKGTFIKGKELPDLKGTKVLFNNLSPIEMPLVAVI